ncbi:hypothetical protein EUTSA_v10027120mg [Eutrema salsugineum]|uniref:RING-type domain-containing protein n=1 Tax=Eutrema salsugineum TaxID=72664 RepID=V4P7N9_EUTSA|nr:NEP1-interacting protein-like 1 [Eutrema salsugineum]ESQ55606.1 hypothetical protein EUTSA_v10027120mg [Eutrema salsugineum]
MADVCSTRWHVNYEFEKYSVDSTSSGSFSIEIRETERTSIRSRSGHETLIRQRKLEPIEIVSETPSLLLGEEETCSQYVASVLSKTRIASWVQERIAPKISRIAIKIGQEEEEGSFLVKADVKVVKETSFSFNNFIKFDDDYDSEGRLIRPIEQNCIICLEEIVLNGQKSIMSLWCSHSFHRDCILSWLRLKHSCPTCRDDILKRLEMNGATFTLEDYRNFISSFS